MKPNVIRKYLLLSCFYLFPGIHTCKAYSVLTHEAIVDACWQSSIAPLLRHQYPGTSDVDLQLAHAYAYGGAIAPDMGYFPFGSKLFTDLVHYVRSGNLVTALLNEAADVNEYAFALGFMCHYMSDQYGHFIGTNRCVPIVYPQLRKKYGDLVTYEENKTAHKRMEFSFDVLQTAKGNYASLAYHAFIGFRVSRELMERAFKKTYGLDINELPGNLSLAIESFRWSVKNLFPVLTRAAWAMKKKDIRQSQPAATSASFRYKMKRANYYQEYGNKRIKPGLFPGMLSWVMRVAPKIGPLKSLKIKEPGPVAEKLFIYSFDTVLMNCNTAMMQLLHGEHFFPDIDLDTGNETLMGEYKLADKTYADLLLKINRNDFKGVDTALQVNLTRFFGNTALQGTSRRERKRCDKINKANAALGFYKPL